MSDRSSREIRLMMTYGGRKAIDLTLTRRLHLTGGRYQYEMNPTGRPRTLEAPAMATFVHDPSQGLPGLLRRIAKTLERLDP